jgi:hypothetical protein
MTDDPRSLLSLSTGSAGSGRIRYGAAMALYQSGAISAQELELWRIGSANDGHDPAAFLAEYGLSAAQQVLDPIGTLLDEATLYLATLRGPGVAEVRAALAQRSGPLRSGPPRSVHPLANAVVDGHLANALATLAPSHPSLAKAITAASPALEWITHDSYPVADMAPDFLAGHAYCSLMGQAAPYAAHDFDFGLFLIAPHVLYRDHCHRAPELYAPLTGPHGWRFGPDRPLIIKPAHQPIWNDPDRPHLTKVGAIPFLGFFGWTRDVDQPARILPATDWPQLEALRLKAAP